MTTSFTSLCTNEVYSNLKALLDMLRVTDHVHVKYAMLVQTFNDVLWGNTCRELDNIRRLSKFRLYIPTAETNSLAPESMMIWTRSSSFPLV